MYTTKNLISLGNHEGYTIYLDLIERDLKRQALPQTTSTGKMYIAVVLTLAIGRTNLFADLLSNSFFKIFLYGLSVFLSVFISILVAKYIVSKVYSNIVLEKVTYSTEEYREFKKRLEKYNRIMSVLMIALFISALVTSIIYFLYPSFSLLILITVSIFALYLIFKYGELKKRRHFEDYLEVDYTDTADIVD